MDIASSSIGRSLDGIPVASPPPQSRWAWLAELPKLLLGAILLIAIVDLLLGVLLRYVVAQITDFFDWDPIGFFWVEEVGEFALAWLTFVGAGIGIIEGAHFTLNAVTHRFSPGVQRAIWTVNHALILGFGIAACWQGWLLTLLNRALLSPGLSISLGWLYLSGAVGGALIVLCAAIAIVRGPAREPTEVSEHRL